jgi:signal transduction histidine kinase
MGSAKILLAGGGIETEHALLQAFDGDRLSIELVHAGDADETLTAMVSSKFELCVVRAISDQPEFPLAVCAGAKESGVRTPIIVLMDMASRHVEDAFLNAGALVALPWDGSQDAMLRNFVRLTVVLRNSEESLRKTNDHLVQEMLTIQDERERAEAMNIQYVELAENYALATDELEKLNQEKNKFFSIIAHDLRSPFTALLGFTSLLEQRVTVLPKEKIKDYAHTIHESANRVFKLLENLLEWARLQMDRVEYTPHFFALNEIVANTLEILGPVARDKGIVLKESGEAPTAYADSQTIDTVIRNLVSNAIKFTPKGGTITVQYAHTSDHLAQVSIIDTGVGMDVKTAEAIFHLSTNVTTKGTDGEKGTGLGLLLCKEFVERNHGNLSIESEPGVGSTFSFTLPMSAPAANEVECPQTPSSARSAF